MVACANNAAKYIVLPDIKKFDKIKIIKNNCHEYVKVFSIFTQFLNII